ncbi:MAG: folate family ECF transporter S component [Oscillospiraceae bacterium]
MQNEINSTIYKTPFTKSYWKDAFSELKSVKKIIIAALFIALTLVVRSFFIPIPVMGGQRIYFTFFVKALGAVIYGPILSGISGGISDLIGALLFPSGPFFIGYTITSILSSFIYGIFLYRVKLTVVRIFLAKFSVNILANVLVNSLWSAILMGKGYWLLVIARLPKNLILLPFEVAIMVTFFAIMIPITKKQKVINYSPFEKKITWF